MKNKILAVSLVGLLMAGGLVLAGCGKGTCSDFDAEGDCRAYVSETNGALGVSGSSCTDSSCAAWKAMKNPTSVKLTTDSDGYKYKTVNCDC